MLKLNQLFEAKVDILRIKHGKSQTVGTLINEEAYLLAKYLRNERKDWTPRLPSLMVSHALLIGAQQFHRHCRLHGCIITHTH
jgi:hypothetical protein